MIGLKEEPRSGTPGLNDAATYITYWFKRPIEENGLVLGIRLSETQHVSKPNFVMVDDPVLYLIVRMEDQNRILSIMSRAGYYIKDVNTDRKVDGAFVTYTFTQRKKNDSGS